MKKGLFFISLVVISTLFNGCVLDEPKKMDQPILNIYTNDYQAEDTLIIQKYEKKTGVKIQLIYANNGTILDKVSQNPYNARIDLLIVSGESVLFELRKKALLHTIRNTAPFNQLEREFYNTHHTWLPFAYNPLVLVTKTDSSNTCISNSSMFRKVFKDSIQPTFSSAAKSSEYINAFGHSTRFKQWVDARKKIINPNYSVATLSEIALKKEKSNSCAYLLLDSKRHLTTTTSISILKYGRNHKTAEHFLRFYSEFKFQIAASRGELSTFQNIQSSYEIAQLLK